MAKSLSPAKCVLLTVHYASEGNIKALHSFTPTRLDALGPELVLRILLTYLPESLDPQEYRSYVQEVASSLYLDVDREDVEVDISPVNDIDEEQAKRKVKKLKLQEIQPPMFPPHAPKDLLTRFLCHRAYNIDDDTGLLNLMPSLIEPFLDRNEFLRTWYISVVLPLLRLEFEYYPEDESVSMGLRDFESLEGRAGIDFLMQTTKANGDMNVGIENTQKGHVARNIKGLVGPWMYGHTDRKRRRLNDDEAISPLEREESALNNRFRKIALEGISAEDRTGHDWEYMYRWLVSHAQENFPLIVDAVDGWDGPGDVDFGGLNSGNSDQYLDEDVQSKLEAQYAQTAFAACYAVQADTEQTIRGAHSILARLAELLDFIPPPDLATSVESLPKIERHAVLLDESQTLADLEPDALLRPEHPLTTPRVETYVLLQMIVYSAYQFSGLGYPISLASVARLHFYASSEDQTSVLQKMLRGLTKSGARKDDAQWTADRAKLMWLWNWGIDAEDHAATNGAGALGRIPKEKFEEEMLKCFTETSCYEFAIKLYLQSPQQLLPTESVERIILATAMEAYDGATNGNKARGGMKKANDIITTFKSYFSNSIRFQQASSLIAATHALSFYSLTLQHGVPFKPVSIRVSQDPISLIDKVLEQNPGSYTKLDDIVAIGRNLISAGLPQKTDSDGSTNAETLEARKEDAERRVTFMCIEAALREDDFETAYSYIVSRLTPPAADIEAPANNDAPKRHIRNVSKSSIRSGDGKSDDDISWRAAFLAGRYRGSTSSPPSLRRLEQRTELLSLALLLAPVSALTEILTAWRKCEEETTSMRLASQQAEEDFDTWADKRQSMSALPGNFSAEQPPMVLNQQRREMGRMTGTGRNESDAPVSMFDLTRSAAQAFSKNAFPLRGAATTARAASGHESLGMEESTDSLGSESAFSGGDGQRTRKRDMVANAVSGGLASGIGWMLGATPVGQQQQQGQEQQ